MYTNNFLSKLRWHPLSFGETKHTTPYFQQMTPRSKIPKRIHTPPHFSPIDLTVLTYNRIFIFNSFFFFFFSESCIAFYTTKVLGQVKAQNPGEENLSFHILRRT